MYEATIQQINPIIKAPISLITRSNPPESESTLGRYNVTMTYS